jgi:hypothetical protein
LTTPPVRRVCQAIAATALVLGPTRASGQIQHPDTVPFPKAAFDSNVAVADWLLRYDRAAWLTSDLVMKEPKAVIEQLGEEWFAWPEGERWHAAYGRYDDVADRFTPILHYAQADSGFAPIAAPVDTSALTAYARVLARSRAMLAPALHSDRVRYNPYVRRLPDLRLEVWYLPAGFGGMFFEGAEARFLFDSTGRTVVDSATSVYRLRAWRPDTTAVIRLRYDAAEVPTVGSIFFLYQFGRWFKNVMIDTKYHLTTLGRGAWISAVKPPAPSTPAGAPR